MFLTFAWRLIDIMVAIGVACTLCAFLPVLTFGGTALLYYLRSPRGAAGSHQVLPMQKARTPQQRLPRE